RQGRVARAARRASDEGHARRAGRARERRRRRPRLRRPAYRGADRGHPARPEVWASLDAELRRLFDHPRAGPLPVRAVCVDSGGHHTQAVYAFTAQRAARNVWAIKGRGGPGLPLWPRRPPKPNEKGFVCHVLGVDAGKEAVLARLRRAEHGPGFCHFPAGRDLDYFRGLTAERRVRSFRRGVAYFQWLKDRSANNEPLDCRVYASAALQGLVARGLRLDAEAARIADLPLREPGQTPAPAARPARIKSSWMER
ncbi:terminase gpA endonuclease subunit, partial [Methylocella sp.]|uniref:terminase gpA endonuclease subunit n=1 Tax=Methylocella sp. TaxID=1978226 RepID=UPI003784DFB8